MSLRVLTIIAVSTFLPCILASWGDGTDSTITMGYKQSYEPKTTLWGAPPSPAQLASTNIPQITLASSTTQPASSQPALSTTFTPPKQCQTSLAMLKTDSDQIWYNPLVPVPNKTVSECYPSEFATVVLQLFDSTTLPAFSPLVCPEGWSTAWSSDTQTLCNWSTALDSAAETTCSCPTACIYIVCCPW